VFKDRVPRKIFGPERDEVTREWIELHDEELFTPNTILVIKSRMRWAGHVARMGDRRGAARVW